MTTSLKSSQPQRSTRGICGLALACALCCFQAAHGTPLAPIASPLTPNDPSVSANLQLWLLANNTNVTTSGGTVTGWNDQSGLGHNFTAFNVPNAGGTLQTVTAPMSVTTTTNNGQTFGVVDTGSVTPGTDITHSYFNGAGGFNIASGGGLSLSAGVGSTYFVVLKTSADTGAGFARIVGTDPTAGGLSFRNVSQAGVLQQTYDGTTVQSGTSAVSTGQFLVDAIRFNSTLSGSITDTALFVNGNKQDFAPANLSAVDAFVLGYNPNAGSPSNPVFQGQIAQVLVYNGALTDAQVLGISQSIGQQDGVFSVPTPEPSTFVLAAVALGLIAVVQRRRRR